MYKGNKFFYISIILVILSLFLSVHNPIVRDLFGSITAIVLFSGLVNAVLMIASVILVDKGIKSNQLSPGVGKWIKVMPLVLFAVILYHLISGLFFFGIL